MNKKRKSIQGFCQNCQKDISDDLTNKDACNCSERKYQ